MASKDKQQNDKSRGVEFFPASHLLQAKTRFIDKNLNSVIKKAMLGLKELADEYISWAEGDLERMSAAFKTLRTDLDSEEAIARIYTIAHDMKGQGSTFGYPLVTLVMHNLTKILYDRKRFDAKELELVELHILSAKQVISNKLEGKGGEMGDVIIAGLRAASKTP